jgi:uncharacterized protein YciW
MDQNEDVIATLAGIAPKSALAEVVAGRADIMALTQQTYAAALHPKDPGGLSHIERAALACRIAALNADADFEAHFRKLTGVGIGAEIADIGFDGGDDLRLRALIRHVDLVAQSPKNATEGDIRRLQAAGLSDADIVRLSELVAFVSYQIRVTAGLRLLKE